MTGIPHDPGGSHSASAPPPYSGDAEAEARAATNSLGELFAEFTRDFSTLMRQEVALAKAELKESASTAGKGAGLLSGAAVAAHMVLLFLSLALWWALGHLMDLGWAAVVVALVWAVIAAVLAVVGRKNLQSVRGVPETVDTVKDIPPTLKPHGDTP
jgi:Putative Actinobacterial Holin-X, holin superfamily III